jgi:hypothetical protein
MVLMFFIDVFAWFTRLCRFRYAIVLEYPDGTQEEFMRWPWLSGAINGRDGGQAELQADARRYYEHGGRLKVVDTRAGA